MKEEGASDRGSSLRLAAEKEGILAWYLGRTCSWYQSPKGDRERHSAKPNEEFITTQNLVF
jgi:hypothetical protein